MTLEINSPTRKRLAPLKVASAYPHVIKTKAGTTGRQTKINQDIAIVEEKLPHGPKLYCVCDGHGVNGHLVSAFIKTTLISITLYTKRKPQRRSKEVSQPSRQRQVRRNSISDPANYQPTTLRLRY